MNKLSDLQRAATKKSARTKFIQLFKELASLDNAYKLQRLEGPFKTTELVIVKTDKNHYVRVFLVARSNGYASAKTNYYVHFDTDNGLIDFTKNWKIEMNDLFFKVYEKVIDLMEKVVRDEITTSNIKRNEADALAAVKKVFGKRLTGASVKGSQVRATMVFGADQWRDPKVDFTYDDDHKTYTFTNTPKMDKDQFDRIVAILMEVKPDTVLSLIEGAK